MNIDDALAVALSGPERAEDRTALDPTERLYQRCVVAGNEAEFGAAAARSVDRGFDAVCVLVRLFAAHPGMTDAEGWIDRLLASPEQFPEVPSSIPGGVGHTVRTLALKAALTFSDPPRPAVVALARAHVVRPGGAFGLLYLLWKRDREWVDAQLTEILANNPDAGAQAYAELVRFGRTPDAALDVVLRLTPAVRAEDFEYSLRALPADVQRRLIARLLAHPQLPS